MEPVCCWAYAASGAISAATSQSFFVILVLLSSCSSFTGCFSGGVGRLSPVGCIRNGVVDSCFGEGAEAQDATFACSAGGLVARIARPRYMEGRAQFKAAADYLMLTHGDKWRFDADGAVARAGADELLEGLVIDRAAVGITGAVLFHRTDVNGLGAYHLGPADGGGEKVRVAEGHIGDRDTGADDVGIGPLVRCIGDGGARIGERRAADDAEEVDGEREKLRQLEFLGDGAGGL